MNLVASIFISLLIVPMLIGAVVTSGRYVIRERSRVRRAARVGELIWSEIEYEGSIRKMDGGADRITGGDLVGLITFNESIRASFPFKDRGVISYVWSRAEDSSIHLYVGVTEEHYADGAQVRIAARSVGANAVRVDSPPYIPTEDISIAYRGKSIPSLTAEVVKEGGALAKSLSSTIEKLDKSIAVAVVITTEAIRTSEQNQLVGYITADNLASGGDALNFGGMGIQAQHMSNQPVRATIVASTSVPRQGKRSLSQSVLTSAINSIATGGWSYLVRPFTTAAVGRTGVTLSSIAAVLAIFFTAIQAMPWFMGIPMIIAAGGAGWFSLSKSGTLSMEVVKDRLSRGEFNVPPYVFHLWNPRWFVASRILALRYGGNDSGAKEAAPSMRQVNYIRPLALFEAVSFPPAFSRLGVDVHSNPSLSRGIPGSMVETEYPIFYGQSGSGQFISLDLRDLHYSMYTAGAPNSGKTNFLQVIFAGVVKACIDRANGMAITPIWAETKGEGAQDAWAIAKHHPQAIFIEAHNKQSQFRLSLEGRRISEGASVDEVVANIDVLVSGMQFAYGDGIRAASREVIQNSLNIAMLLDETDIEFLGLEGYVNAQKPNIMDLASILLGADSRVDPGQRILELQENHNADVAHDDRKRALVMCISTLSRFFDPAQRRQSQSGNVIGPALNKFSQMREARTMWTPDGRPTASPAHFPFHFAPIVLNMGPYKLDDGQYDSSIGASTAKRLLLITNYILWNTIKAKCSGWQAMGRRIPMFFDEVADVAVDSQNDDVANVIAEAGKEGRSRGASYFLGSQSPSQMPFQARGTVLGSRTKFWFNLHESNDLKVAIQEISSASDEQDIYTTNDIHSLPNGTAVGVMQRGEKPTPPFTLQVPWAVEWGEILLQENISVGDAIVEYYELQSRKREEKRREVERSRIG